MHFRRSLFFLIVSLMLMMHPYASADGTWYNVVETPPQEDLGFRVSEYTGTVTITFMGDCTLGGEEKSERNYLGFRKVVEANGMEFPFRYLKELTLQDDLTVANLEGVLTDRDLKKVEKEYNFRGPSSYTEILASGGVDCVTLANNHSHDYGESGYSDTKSALNEAGIFWFGTDSAAVWESSDRVLIGFTGVSYSLSGNRYKAFQAQMKYLQDLGCDAIFTVMHTGTEYDYHPDTMQKTVAGRAVSCGASLVVGHHPHVVQGYALTDGIPVVYSLGNCSFAGTTHAKDSDALIVQAELSFLEGSLSTVTLHFYPISITSDSRHNNYSPMFLSGRDAERVLRKMKESTGMDPGSFENGSGASVTFSVP